MTTSVERPRSKGVQPPKYIEEMVRQAHIVPEGTTRILRTFPVTQIAVESKGKIIPTKQLFEVLAHSTNPKQPGITPDDAKNLRKRSKMLLSLGFDHNNWTTVIEFEQGRMNIYGHSEKSPHVWLMYTIFDRKDRVVMEECMIAGSKSTLDRITRPRKNHI